MLSWCARPTRARGHRRCSTWKGGPASAPRLPPGSIWGRAPVIRSPRDVVLVDQRGTGGSAALRCAAIERRPAWEDGSTAEDAAACRRELSARADLTRYTTEHAARDLDRVREALGAPSIDIWALSYGTRLAQVYLKRFPSRVHAAVLVGFAPLDYRTPLFHAVNAQRVLDLIFYECQRDSSCAERYPQLREDWQAVLRRVDGSPIRLTIQGSAVALGRGRFGELFRNMLGTAAGQRAAAAIIHAAAHGDFAPFAAAAAASSPAVAEGLYPVNRLHRSRAAHPAGRVGHDRRHVSRRLSRIAGAARLLGMAARGAAGRLLRPSSRVDSNPGPERFDGQCDHARLGSRILLGDGRMLQFVSIPDLGHGPFDLGAWTEGDCFNRLAAHFFEDPGHPDAACVAHMTPPLFKQP